MRGLSSGEETLAACGPNLCAQVSAVLPVTGPPSLPGPSESSLLAPHHHLLVRTQTETVLAWLPQQHLGHPQGTLSLHKEEAVGESPGRC